MNKIISRLLPAMALLLPLAACTDNDYEELDKGNTPLALSVSAPAVTLAEEFHAQNAVTLSWTSGTNYGTGRRISYNLEIAPAGTGFAEPYIACNYVQNQYEWGPKVEELNTIALETFHLQPGVEAALDARVVAMVDDIAEDQVADATFSITPYAPAPETLYLTGSATPGGDNLANASEMQRTDNGMFSWTGQLDAGEFVLVPSTSALYPQYAGEGEGKLVLRKDDSSQGKGIAIDHSHVYKVDVNLLDLTIAISEVSGDVPAFTELFFVGNETDWSFWPMTVDPLNPYLFHIGVFFTKGGEFKFGTQNGNWENMLKATEPNAPYTSQAMEYVKGFDPDNKWVLKDTEINQAYKIIVDIHTGAYKMIMTPFTPYSEIWMVGDATPNGWDLGNATPMTRDADNANIFTWTGHLNAGELKFSCDKKDDWMGAWFMAAQENAPATGAVQNVIFVDKGSKEQAALYPDLNLPDVDYKWRISQAGNYRITLNQLTQTVTITLL